MPICVVVFKEIQEANDLALKLRTDSTNRVKAQLIKPKDYVIPASNTQDSVNNAKEGASPYKDIDSIQLLSPKLARQLRQKTMAFWLMPFGFITGLTFTKMTGLQTFSNMGFDPIAEPLIGSFLGMGSGLIGSYFASASINPNNNDDIRALRKLNTEGLWLLLLETPLEIDLPWGKLQASKNLKIIRLNNN